MSTPSNVISAEKLLEAMHDTVQAGRATFPAGVEWLRFLEQFNAASTQIATDMISGALRPDEAPGLVGVIGLALQHLGVEPAQLLRKLWQADGVPTVAATDGSELRAHWQPLWELMTEAQQTAFRRAYYISYLQDDDNGGELAAQWESSDNPGVVEQLCLDEMGGAFKDVPRPTSTTSLLDYAYMRHAYMRVNDENIGQDHPPFERIISRPI